MSRKLLSICIPVHNRKEIFEVCLIQACKSCENFENDVEIVVSDNFSSDKLSIVVDSVRKKYPKTDIIYNRNTENIGLARNFLKVVVLSSGEFCWIIGSDDFIKAKGVKELISIIKQNLDIDFISCNYDLININEKTTSDNRKTVDDFYLKLEDDSFHIEHIAPKDSFRVKELDDLIEPRFNNVLLGATMAGIFRKDLWDKVNFEKANLRGFNTLKTTYPHCYVYAKAFLGKHAYYCGETLITIGEGVREWSTQTGKGFWESSLPVIYFNIFGELLDEYKINGLKESSYKKSLKWTSSYAGRLFFPIFWRKHILRRDIKDGDLLKLFKTLKKYFKVPKFYFSVLKGAIYYIWKGDLS